MDCPAITKNKVLGEYIGEETAPISFWSLKVLPRVSYTTTQVTYLWEGEKLLSSV